MRKQKPDGNKTPTKIENLSKLIQLETKIQQYKNDFIFKTYREPNYVLIHPIHKSHLYDYCNQYYSSSINGRITTILGMKLIWTDDINEDNIICLIDNCKL